MMRKCLLLVVIVLSAASGVHILVLLVALMLYPLALLFVLLVLASPLLCGFVLWLLWRRVHDGEFPSWVGSAVRRVRTFVFGRRRPVSEQAKT